MNSVNRCFEMYDDLFILIGDHASALKGTNTGAFVHFDSQSKNRDEMPAFEGNTIIFMFKSPNQMYAHSSTARSKPCLS